MFHFASLLLPSSAVAPSDPLVPLKPLFAPKQAGGNWRSSILLAMALLAVAVIAGIWRSYSLS